MSWKYLKRFGKLFKETPFAVSVARAYEDDTSNIDSLVRVLVAEDHFLPVICELARQDMKATGSSCGLFARQDSVVTACCRIYFLVTGTKYLKRVLKPLLEKITDKEIVTGTEDAKQLTAFAESVLHAVLTSAAKVPAELRQLIYSLQILMADEEKRPSNAELMQSLTERRRLRSSSAIVVGPTRFLNSPSTALPLRSLLESRPSSNSLSQLKEKHIQIGYPAELTTPRGPSSPRCSSSRPSSPRGSPATSVAPAAAATSPSEFKGNRVVSSLFFLRFVCPAIIHPGNWSLMKPYSNPTVLKNAVFTAKLLQAAVSAMEDPQAFLLDADIKQLVASSASLYMAFCKDMMQPPSESKPDPEFILSAEDHYLSLRTLYLFVNETRDKILSRLDSELASSIEKSLNKIEAGIKNEQRNRQMKLYSVS